MKILIIGAAGQVGGFLLKAMAPRHTVYGADMNSADYPLLDIRDPRAVEEAIRGLAPDRVVLTAAMTHVDKCEQLPAESEASNVRGPEYVAQACQKIKAGMVFFSTDYIFDGQNGPYRETDAPHPLSVYGQHKWAAEKIVAATVSRHLIVRTMNVYSYLPGTMNFFMQLHDRVLRREPIAAANDQMIHPTQAVNLAEALGELMEQGANGVYHLAGTTWMARDEFARRVVAALGADPQQVESKTTAAFNLPAARPLRSGLLTAKAQADLRQHRLWDIDEALAFTLRQMKGLV